MKFSNEGLDKRLVFGTRWMSIFFFIELVIDNSEVEKDNGGKLS